MQEQGESMRIMYHIVCVYILYDFVYNIYKCMYPILNLSLSVESEWSDSLLSYFISFFSSHVCVFLFF